MCDKNQKYVITGKDWMPFNLIPPILDQIWCILGVFGCVLHLLNLRTEKKNQQQKKQKQKQTLTNPMLSLHHCLAKVVFQRCNYISYGPTENLEWKFMGSSVILCDHTCTSAHYRWNSRQEGRESGLVNSWIPSLGPRKRDF